MKQVFINSKRQCIESVNVDIQYSFRNLYPIMGLQCDMLEQISYINIGDDLLAVLIDEEGRFGTHGLSDKGYVGFRIDVSERGDWSEYFECVGNGAIVGCNMGGETCEIEDMKNVMLNIALRTEFLTGSEVTRLKLC
jgi:hypothetical protein